MSFCNICKKKYASYNSLWVHNKKYHVNNLKVESKILINNPNTLINDQNTLICQHCNHLSKNKYLLKKHHTRCSIKKYFDEQKSNIEQKSNYNPSIKQSDNSDELKLKIKLAEIELAEIESKKINDEKESQKIKLELYKEEKEILKLKIKLNASNKSLNKSSNGSIKNINNQLLNNSHNVINNNNVTNNFQIIGLGKENLVENLTKHEKREIIKARYGCLDRVMTIAHCGKYNQFKNIIITNLKDDYAYKYDDTTNTFICIGKNEIMTELINERLEDIKEIYEELSATDKIDEKTKNIIQDFFKQIENNEKFIDEDSGITYKNYRAYREHKVKILIYNNSDKMTKDLAIVLDESFMTNFRLPTSNKQIINNVLDV